MVGAQEEGACGRGEAWEEMTRAGPHCQAPLSFLPVLCPSTPGTGRGSPSHPRRPKASPTLTNFSEGAKQPTQRDTRIQPRA